MDDLKRDVARITVELVSPINIGSGGIDDFVDSVFITDANDLPCLPGTSIAGVLRAAWRAFKGEDGAKDLFGFQDEKDGARSRIEISFGIIHDSNDMPVPPRLPEEEIERDLVLKAARQQQVRQHVKLTHHGVAADKALFDEAVVPAGNRFTFEVCVLGGDDSVLDEIIGLFGSGMVRLGAKTRSGLGELKLIRVNRRRFDLTKPEDMKAYSSLPVGLHVNVDESLLPPYEPREVSDSGAFEVVANVMLDPEGFWMVGGGDPGEAEEGLPGDRNKAPDMVPYREGRVRWQEQGGKFRGDFMFEKQDVVVPASSIKGALRHRTAYHYNFFTGVFSDKLGKEDKLDDHDGLSCPGTKILFGEMLHHKKHTGRAGLVTISDVVAGRPKQKRMMHVSLDRFTGGPIDGALFEEAPCYKGRRPWNLRIGIRRLPGDGKTNDEKDVYAVACKALGRAIEDLVEGRLQIGAGSGRGHGFFRGKVSWSDDGKLAKGENGGES
ncbi:MAG: hypothetical protein GXP49_06260 [Deltaproteobacteria bacterium]|nr:hypothetical protein [Deltaproteobacteria bacterium]